MNHKTTKFALTPAVSAIFGTVLVSMLTTSAFAANQEYFDCWVEKVTRLAPDVRASFGAADDNSALCGCFKAIENGPVTQVFGAPRPHIIPCPDGSCLQGSALEQCMDNIRQVTMSLSDFVDGRSMAGSIPLGFDEGWEMTPFGEYFNQRADRAKDITCFLNVHERPWAPKKKDASVFRISGLPKKLLPEAELRFTDYSDVRCLDNGVLTGFSFNGYVENVRHVDDKGEMQGEEIGYMNDPSYPSRQGENWGKVRWTANYKNGVREGNAYFYKSSVDDGVNPDKPQYYFKHLEVPYHQGMANGNARMFSADGFVMAEMPVKRGELYGRTVINNPFKKKKVALTFNAGNLEGFVDFGDFGGVFHQGLPNGLITFWSVKDTCYEWLPGSAVCYTERLKKKQWGTYKMGKFKGKMECHDGRKGDVNLVCSDPVQDSINADPHEIAKKARATAELAKLNIQKAKDAVTEAQQAVVRAQEDLKRVEAEAEKAEKAAVAAEEAVKPKDVDCDSILAGVKENAPAESDSLAVLCKEKASAKNLAEETPAEEKAAAEKPAADKASAGKDKKASATEKTAVDKAATDKGKKAAAGKRKKK
ncbi:MAG: hypothetical protein HUK19_00630 [Fibrobacter sp.]|nr:hypothetical protein [Fibrobacter sp.]